MRCSLCKSDLPTATPVYRFLAGRLHKRRVDFGPGAAMICETCKPSFNGVSAISDWHSSLCAECGRKVYNSYQPKRTFLCSAECRQRRATRNEREKRKVDRGTKQCLRCETVFQPGRKVSLYCSSPCRQAAYRERLRFSAGS